MRLYGLDKSKVLWSCVFSPVERVEGGLDCPPLQAQLPTEPFNDGPPACSQGKLR